MPLSSWPLKLYFALKVAKGEPITFGTLCLFFVTVFYGSFLQLFSEVMVADHSVIKDIRLLASSGYAQT